MSSGKYLITGACGQIGEALAKYLRAAVGKHNVIASDIVEPQETLKSEGPFMKLDVLDPRAFEQAVVENDVKNVLHLAAILSTAGESNLAGAFDLNVKSLKHIFLLALKHNYSVYIPSTIASMGPETQLVNTPDTCVQKAHNIYGVSKSFAERLGEYFHAVHGIDFRCLRYPGMMSPRHSVGVTTSYPVDAFYSYAKTKSYECYVGPDTQLPYAYDEDCMENTVRFIMTPNDRLRKRVYNYAAYTLTPAKLFETLQNSCMPDLKVTYNVVPFKQKLLDGWPRSLDCSAAIDDWGMSNRYSLEEACRRIYQVVVEKKQRD